MNIHGVSNSKNYSSPYRKQRPTLYENLNIFCKTVRSSIDIIKIILFFLTFYLIAFCYRHLSSKIQSENLNVMLANLSSTKVYSLPEFKSNQTKSKKDQNLNSWNIHSLIHSNSVGNGECNSIKQFSDFFPLSSIPSPSAELLKSLRDQEILQKRCVNDIKNWEDHFSKSEEGYEDCNYLIWMDDKGGLGNRFLSLMSAFIYSVITNRVFFIHSLYLNFLLCNPLPETSWWLPKTFPISKLRSFKTYTQFVNAENNNFDVVDVMLRHTYERILDDKRNHFFCDYVQNKLKKVRWIRFESNQYLVPAFFLIPSFQERLSSLFPHSLTTPYLARYLLHPSNLVWDRIVRIRQTYFQTSTLRLGLQIRTLGGYCDVVAQKVHNCIKKSNILPKIMSDEAYQQYLKGQGQSQSQSQNETSTFSEVSKMKREIYSLFIASLNLSYYDYFKNVYDKKPLEDGSFVMVQFVSHESEEVHNIEKDIEAMVDIWLLGMTNMLFQSRFSTFGYISKALGGPQSYFINTKECKASAEPLCEPVFSGEACFHFPPTKLKCPNLPSLNSTDLSTLGPNLNSCQDVKQGITLYPV